MFGRRRRSERDFREEIDAHVALEAERLREAGLASDEAVVAARRAFGNRTRAQEDFYQRGRPLWFDHVWQDVRYAARSLRHTPGFTLVAVLTLTLGIGATTAVFSVINAVLLNPLPFKNAHRLVWAWGEYQGGGAQAAVSPPDFEDFRAENRTFEYLGAFSWFDSARNWRLQDHAEQVQGTMINAGFFEALGVTPLAGRIFTVADEQFQEPHSVILSYRFWKRTYGGDPGVVGQQVRVNSSELTVVGVAPRSFDYPHSTDFWFPAPMLNAGIQRRVGHFLRPIGLLRPGVPIARAQADLDRIASRLARLYPESNKGWGVRLRPLQDVIVGPVRPVLLILFGAVTLVLLIACVNVANLLLARNTARQRELATRIALGAGRRRILNQLLVESFLLATLAIPCALLLAQLSIVVLRKLGPETMPRLDEVRLDSHVLLFSAALLLLTTLFFGLLPGWLATQAAPNRRLVENTRTGLSRRRQFLGSLLVVSQTTLALCLLIAAALLSESFWKILHAPPGFSSRDVLASDLILPTATYKDSATRDAFLSEVMEKVRALPGVQAAGGISEMPMNDEPNDTFFTTPGHPQYGFDAKKDEQFRMITPGYFHTLRIALLQGRLFRDSDKSRAAHVMIVDSLFAAKYFPGQDALGKHLLIYEGTPQFVNREIVGIVAAIRTFSLQTPPAPIMYFPYAQSGSTEMHLMVRAADPLSLAQTIRRLVTARDPDIAIANFRTMEQVVSQSTASDRFTSFLLKSFAILALALAVAGVYGVFSYIVVQQTHDLGIRMALGARPRQMLALILRRGLHLSLCAVALGLLAAWFLMRVLSNQLYQVKPRDPAVYAITALLLIFAALAACYLPARRAARLDPMTALREE